MYEAPRSIWLEQDFFLPPSSGCTETGRLRTVDNGLYKREWSCDRAPRGGLGGLGTLAPGWQDVALPDCSDGHAAIWLTEELVARPGSTANQTAESCTATDVTRDASTFQRAYCCPTDVVTDVRKRAFTAVQQNYLNPVRRKISAEGLHPLATGAIIVGALAAVGVGGAYLWKRFRT